MEGTRCRKWSRGTGVPTQRHCDAALDKRLGLKRRATPGSAGRPRTLLLAHRKQFRWKLRNGSAELTSGSARAVDANVLGRQLGDRPQRAGVQCSAPLTGALAWVGARPQPSLLLLVCSVSQEATDHLCQVSIGGSTGDAGLFKGGRRMHCPYCSVPSVQVPQTRSSKPLPHTPPIPRALALRWPWASICQANEPMKRDNRTQQRPGEDWPHQWAAP